MPASVSTASDWCPSVWPGVAITRIAGVISWSPSMRRYVAPGASIHSQDRVVGGVSNLPFGRLHVDARARKGAVLTGVVRVEVAVHDVRDLVLFDTDLAQDVEDRSADRRVHLVELRVAEAEPGVEQEHPVGMPDDTAHDDTTSVGQSRFGEAELGQLERHDLDVGHGSVGSPSVWVRQRSTWRRKGLPPPIGTRATPFGG